MVHEIVSNSEKKENESSSTSDVVSSNSTSLTQGNEHREVAQEGEEVIEELQAQAQENPTLSGKSAIVE